MSFFLVIEGLDGAGTTTQTRRVAEALRGRGQEVHTTREPSDGPIGKMIREMIGLRLTLPGSTTQAPRPVSRPTLALLFAADRLYHVDAEIEPALAQGHVVISDRYVASSLVYQGDIDGTEAVDYDWVRRLNERARVPELTVFLRASPELSLQRLEGRAERDLFETREKLTRLARRYDEVVDLLSTLGHPVLTLEADQPPEAITAAILAALPGE